jgi:hypothetical protein
VRLGAERGLSAEELERISEQVLGRIAQEGEITFLITVTASEPNSGRARISIADTVLVNTLGQKFAPRRWDRVFDAGLDLSAGYRYGFVMYPAAYVDSSGICVPALDFGRDTSITIRSEHVQVDDETRILVWSIPLSPVGGYIAQVLPTPEPIPTPTQVPTPTPRIEPRAAPTPAREGGADAQFWLELAKFVFDVVVFLWTSA